MAELSLVQHRNQLVTDLGALLEASKVKVQEHAGVFDLGELKRYAIGAPCVLIAVTEFVDGDVLGEVSGYVQAGAWIVTQAGRLREGEGNVLAGVAKAADMNLQLGTALVGIGKHGGLKTVASGAPEQLRYRNLHSSALGDEGVCIGSVTWRQTLDMPAPPPKVELPDFLRLFQTIVPTPSHAGVTAANHINTRTE